MKKEDDFIKEKLDILHDTSKLDYTPPDRTEKNREIAEYFGEYIKKEKCSTKIDKTRNKKFVLGFVSGAGALLLIGIFVIVGIILNQNGNQGGDDFFYNDFDLASNIYVLTEFQDSFDTLLPDMSVVSDLSIKVYRHEEKNTDVYALIKYKTQNDEEIELIIVFVENYDLQNKQLYDALEQTGQTTLFSYNYRIMEDNEVSYAKFTYNNNRYYIKLNSETPENINSFVESFR